jgi:hypothetical protein
VSPARSTSVSARHLDKRQPPATGSGFEDLGKCERMLLRVLASRHPDPTSKPQLGVLSGYSTGSSTFSNGLGRLRSLGFVRGLDITAAGLDAIGPVEPLPTGPALVQHWMGQIGKAEATMLQALTYNRAGLSKEELAEVSGYSTGSSTFSNAVGRLRSLELASKGWPLVASQVLFG